MLVRPQTRTEFKYSLAVNIPPACLTFDPCELVLFVFGSSAATTILAVFVHENVQRVQRVCVCASIYPHKETDGNLLMF